MTQELLTQQVLDYVSDDRLALWHDEHSEPPSLADAYDIAYANLPEEVAAEAEAALATAADSWA